MKMLGSKNSAGAQKPVETSEVANCTEQENPNIEESKIPF